MRSIPLIVHIQPFRRPFRAKQIERNAPRTKTSPLLPSLSEHCQIIKHSVHSPMVAVGPISLYAQIKNIHNPDTRARRIEQTWFLLAKKFRVFYCQQNLNFSFFEFQIFACQTNWLSACQKIVLAIWRRDGQSHFPKQTTNLRNIHWGNLPSLILHLSLEKLIIIFFKFFKINQKSK